MRPTARAVVLFAAGIPLALGVVLMGGDLWTLGFVGEEERVAITLRPAAG